MTLPIMGDMEGTCCFVTRCRHSPETGRAGAVQMSGDSSNLHLDELRRKCRLDHDGDRAVGELRSRRPRISRRPCGRSAMTCRLRSPILSITASPPVPARSESSIPPILARHGWPWSMTAAAWMPPGSAGRCALRETQMNSAPRATWGGSAWALRPLRCPRPAGSRCSPAAPTALWTP